MRVETKTRYPAANRAIALGVVVLFCFQLSRFYLIIQFDLAQCFDPTHNHSHATTSPGAHHHHPEGEEAPARSHDDGYYFQHCKDTFDGIGLTPAQPLGVPVAVSCQLPESTWGNALSETPQPSENYLPPPFQPPRYLS